MHGTESQEPRYCHLLEVLDGAASLRMAVRQAEEVLGDADLPEEDRDVLRTVLEASRERLERISAVLMHTDQDGVEALGLDRAEENLDLSESELLEAGRAAGSGSEDAERAAARAIDRIGRSLRLSSRSVVEEFLSHSSPLLRAAAMKVLGLHWRLRDYAERIRWSLASEPVADCRRAAALSLGSLFEGTRDPEIGRELVEALLKEGEEEDVRWASYYALLDVEGQGRGARPLPIEEFDPPRHVDPEIIARYQPRN